MRSMYFTGLGTAVPPRSFTQRECWEALQRADRPEITARTRAILQGILTHDNGIERRSLALDNLDEGFDLDPDTLHRRFAEERARARLRSGRGVRSPTRSSAAGEIDAVVVSTCTGYLCPGLTSYVAEALGLRPDAVPLDLVGQGCGAALPNLRTAEALVASRRADHVLSICVEVCSAAFYLDDDLGVLVSACLFGDGAGAAVLSASPRGDARRVRWMSGASLNAPEHRDALRFEQRGGMLRNILTLPVPKLAAEHARRAARHGARGCGPRAARHRRVGDARGRPARARGAARRASAWMRRTSRVSAALLSKYGNLSSPFVLFVLQERVARGARPAAPGGCRPSAPASAATARSSRSRERSVEMTRSVEPEWLDVLPADDPRALRSRRDLRRVNALMANARIVARELRRAAALDRHARGDRRRRRRFRGAPRPRAAAGRGRRHVHAARPAGHRRARHRGRDRAPRLEGASGPGRRIRLAGERQAPRATRSSRTCSCITSTRAALAAMLALIAARTRCFVACEPRRSGVALAGSRLLGLVGCNDVTRHDAVTSVRAGFRDGELSALWPRAGGWELQEGARGLFSHCFVARRA